MATKRQTPTTPTTTPTGYTGGSATDIAGGLNLDPLPTAGPSGITLQPAAPIGVPRYATDPNTGLIATEEVLRWNDDGTPIMDPKTGKQATQKQYAPWTATVRRGVDFGTVGAGMGGAFGGVLPGPRITKVKPQYYEGDDVGQLGEMLPEEIWTLQQNMATAGLYGAKPNYQPGKADDTTIAALRKAMEVANSTGNDYLTVVQNWMQISKTAPKAPPPPHATQISTPTDLAATFKTAALASLGRSLTRAETDRYVQAYQALETSAGDAAATAQLQGGTFQGAPDPSNYLAEQLQTNNPREYEQNSLLNTVMKFRTFLNGAGPSLPTRGAG